ncbi:uncharacterized protein [Struthio camelus]|uniref:uncharacterized protein isoform X1 n=1 Tax=Struthio camelus TaxID=8801 RepID=UPI003603E052
MEQLEDQLSFGTMVCPVCQGAWFHRACVQGQAFSAGRACFRCPQCQNKRKFLAEMLKMGIMVPFRLPTWEEDGHFDELYERHSRCDAGRCLYRRGREQAEESGYVSKAATWQVAARQQLPSRREQALSARAGPGAASLRCLCRPCFCLPGLAASPGCHKHRPLCFPRPWELLLCSSCASKGTHRRCSALRTAAEAWECDACAGLGPGKRQSSQVARVWGWGWGWGRARPSSGCSGQGWQGLSARGRAGGTAPASPAPGPCGRAADLPASPHSPQGAARAGRPQHHEPPRIGGGVQLRSSLRLRIRAGHFQHQQPG